MAPKDIPDRSEISLIPAGPRDPDPTCADHKMNDTYFQMVFQAYSMV